MAVDCDYVTIDRNLIWHAGYDVGFSSGISLGHFRPGRRGGHAAAPISLRAVHRRAATLSTPPGTSDTLSVQASFISISGIAFDGQAWGTQTGSHHRELGTSR